MRSAEEPVIVTVIVVGVVGTPAAVIRTIEDWDWTAGVTVTVDGLNVAVNPCGSPLALKATDPLKPEIDVTVTVA